MLFACSGIALQRQPLGTRFLTSSSLVRAYNDKKAEGCGSLKVGAADHASLVLLVCLR
jgi:hypothetical protein